MITSESIHSNCPEIQITYSTTINVIKTIIVSKKEKLYGFLHSDINRFDKIKPHFVKNKISKMKVYLLNHNKLKLTMYNYGGAILLVSMQPILLL
jgi:D-Tyr-tRNAtyr deacylase